MNTNPNPITRPMISTCPLRADFFHAAHHVPIASVTLCGKIFDGEMQINFSDRVYDLTGAPRDWTCAGASFALSSTAS